MESSKHDLRAIGVVVCPAVVARHVRQAAHVAFVVHLVEVEIAVAIRREYELAAFRAPR